MKVFELRALLATLPPDMEVGVESSISDGGAGRDALEGHSISSGYVMDFTQPHGGQEVFLLQIDREEDATAGWVADRPEREGPDNAKDERI